MEVWGTRRHRLVRGRDREGSDQNAEEVGPVGIVREPVLDAGYDDEWVAGFPETVGGFNVGHINTPKDRACSSAPVIYFQSSQATLDEFLANPPDISSLRAVIRSVPEVPSNVALSFSPNPIDSESAAAKDALWNRERVISGCPEPWTDIEKGTEAIGRLRGFAIFQNTDAGSYTDDNAQGVKIKTPTRFGTGQNAWSAAINNVVTNTDFFIQTGMQFEEGDTLIGWSTSGEEPTAYSRVPYLSNTLYQFSISYTSGDWQTCAGNDSNLAVQYECVFHNDATGTHLKSDANTSVWFENANTNANWNSGFPTTITVRDAKIFRNGIGQAWTSEDRLTVHNCGANTYPVSGAMTGTLKNNGIAGWNTGGMPIVCP